MKRTIGLVLGCFLVACGPAAPAVGVNATPAPPIAPSASATRVAAAADDVLGPRPEVPAPAPFTPPAPVVYTAANGMTVWLLERHALPIVALTVSIPTGASSDPKDKAGLAFATATMLDEGAGKLGALDLSRSVEMLGASLRTGANADWSYASITTLKRNIAPAAAILGDVVVRPSFPPAEWKRVHELWLNDLRARASEPEAVASVVSLAALYGPDHPYGHPTEGTIASATKVDLPDVVRSYREAWRPDRATLVAVGDITRAELDANVAKAFGAWKAPAAPPPAPITPAAPAGPWPRVVLVDRPDAPQSVLALVRPGVAANDNDAPPLGRVNIALGGSFTSRLNQDLREEHGWSYGARSRVTFTRGTGSIIASAAVHTEKTGDALKALLADVDGYAHGGLTDEEVGKTRLQARSDLVDILETADGAALRLARDAALGLGPDYEAKASVRRDTAAKPELDKIVGRFFDTKQAIVVIVGPRAKLEGPLATLGFTAPELRDAEGNIPKPAASVPAKSEPTGGKRK